MKDVDIRRVLLAKLTHSINKKDLIVEELGLFKGNCRIDVAVLNGELQGYEIKSHEDTLYRLERQLVTYNQIFDRVTLVASEIHIDSSLKVIPQWWGIMKAKEDNGKISLEIVREAKTNDSVKAEAIVQLLWRDEGLDVLRKFGIAKGFERAKRASIWQCLVESVPLLQLKHEIISVVSSRKYWRAA